MKRTLLRIAGQPVLAVTVALFPARAAGPTIVLEDSQPFYRGSYQAFASPWSTFLERDLVHGRDYRDRISLDPRRFPDGTIFESVWPKRAPTQSGVWGYNALSFGNYDGGRPPERVIPRRIRDVKRLEESFAYRSAGSPYFNLLTELYLTAKPGDEKAKLAEIGFFLHRPRTTDAFAAAGAFIGGYRDQQGRAWTIRRQGTFYLVIPDGDADITSGTLEVMPLLSRLIQDHILTGNEWFNGLAFGIEPAPGGGYTRLNVDHWRVTYE